MLGNELKNGKSAKLRGEEVMVAIHIRPARLAFNETPGSPSPQDQEIGFLAFAVPYEGQSPFVSTTVGPELGAGEELESDEILESGAGLFDRSPIIQIDLPLFLHRTGHFPRVRWHREGDHEPLQVAHQILYGRLRNLEVFTESVGRERRADAPGQHFDEGFREIEVSQSSEVAEVTPNHRVQVAFPPGPGEASVRAEQRLRERPEAPELIEGFSCPPHLAGDFSRAERLDVLVDPLAWIFGGRGGGASPEKLPEQHWREMKEEESARQGVSGPPKEVQTRTSGHQDLESISVGVENPFQNVLPVAVLVNLIEADPGLPKPPRRRAIEESVFPVPAPDRRNVPIEEKVRGSVTPQDGSGQRRLAALAWTGVDTTTCTSLVGTGSVPLGAQQESTAGAEAKGSVMIGARLPVTNEGRGAGKIAASRDPEEGTVIHEWVRGETPSHRARRLHGLPILRPREEARGLIAGGGRARIL